MPDTLRTLLAKRLMPKAPELNVEPMHKYVWETPEAHKLGLLRNPKPADPPKGYPPLPPSPGMFRPDPVINNPEVQRV